MRKPNALVLDLMVRLQNARGLLPLVIGLLIWQLFGPAKSPYFHLLPHGSTASFFCLGAANFGQPLRRLFGHLR